MNRAKIFFLMSLLAIAPVASAETIKGLLDAGKLEARAVVKSPAPHFLKAPVEVVVEVGTPDRFGGSIRVRDFTVPATLVRRTTKTAFNETRRVDGVSWNFQSMRFELHAERAGPMTVPTLTTYITVETETDGVVKGEVKLTVPPIQIEEPPGTEGLDSWVAANELKVEESWQGILERYQVGDAVTRIRTFTIKGSPAMSIPASPRIKLDGVQVYHAPPLVDDNEVGGQLQGTREERVVFTFKGGGTHKVPEGSIHWFNLKTKAVEKINFPGKAIEVSGPAAPNAAALSDSESREGGKGWLYAGLVALVVVLGYLLIRWIGRPSWIRHVRNRFETRHRHRQARADFMQAAEQQDSNRCLALLYQRMSEHAEWQLSTACENDSELKAASDALMAHAFGKGQPPKVADVKHLWDLCKTPEGKREESNVLQINPGPSR